jgi:ABC-type Fe3+/spermidine/putrescine transport system ATPase subunit
LKPWLEIRKLKLKIGDFIFGPVSLALEQGDYLVLLGPSGCGKTTLLRALAGVFEVAPERLFLLGHDVGCVPPQKRHVSYVTQTNDLFPHLSVRKNIAFGLRYLKLSHEERESRIHRMAGLLGIDALLDRNPATLSGGEAKRVALARGLVVTPRVLLLDEPLDGVDHNARAGMFEVLRMIHDELGTATIHVTHDRREARALGQGCAVMREGRIEQIGTLHELFHHPATEFVADFLGDGAPVAERDRIEDHGPLSGGDG